MPLDPDAETLLAMMRAAGRPPMETLTPDEARQSFKAGRAVTQPDPQDVAEVRDLSCPGPHGAIPLRAYRPIGTKADEVLPALVYYHGGGWLLGDLDSHDVACRHYANAAKCRVVSVDYRMAPEYKFPAAVDDCAAATGWVIAQSDALYIDRRRVAVGGDSAGGNLAAVMALMARDGDLPPLVFQLLVYPATDMGMTHDSYRRVTEGVPLTAKTMDWFIDHYLHGPKDRADWRASPLRAADLSGTAPALVLTATYDPLCDEGVAYAERLEREGVRVIHLHFSDQLHGFVGQGRIIRAAGMALGHDGSGAEERAVELTLAASRLSDRHLAPRAHHLQREIGHPLAHVLEREPPFRTMPGVGPRDHPADRQRGEVHVADVEFASRDTLGQQVGQHAVELLAQRVDLGQRIGRQVLLLAEIDRDIGLARQHHLGEIDDRAMQPCGGRSRRLRGARHRFQRQLDGRLAQRRQQIGLAAEMRVDERLGDAQFRGDVVERGAGEAALVEQLDRLFENTLSLVGQYLLAHHPVIHCPPCLC